MPITTRPMEQLQIDFIGPNPKSNKKNRFIIVTVNSFSRYIMAKAVPQARIIEAVLFIQGTIEKYRPSKII